MRNLGAYAVKRWARMCLMLLAIVALSVVPAGAQCLRFDTELISMTLTGGPFPVPLATDPSNVLGDSIAGYGFVNSQVTITMSSQRGTLPGPPSIGLTSAAPGGPPAVPCPGTDPFAPSLLDGGTFYVESFFDVFFDITFTDVDARPGRDFAGQPDGATLVLPDNGPLGISSSHQSIFDAVAPNFGLFPPPEASPYSGGGQIEIPLGGDINGNGEDDKMKLTLVAYSAGDQNRTFIELPDGTIINGFESAEHRLGAVVDLSSDPPFTIGSTLQGGLPDPSSFGGPTTVSSVVVNPQQGLPVPAMGTAGTVVFGVVLLLLAVAFLTRRRAAAGAGLSS